MDTVRRGYEPKDAIEFGDKFTERLNRAAQELRFLLDRGYDIKSVSTFVGNHYLFSERQRLALARMVSPERALQIRKQKELSEPPVSLVLDGFNTIITLEVALSGSLLLQGQDGTIRDLAGLRGTYRIVDKTLLAVELLLRFLDNAGVQDALFYLDQPVSNSGRLRELLLRYAASYAVNVQVALHPQVDQQLKAYDHVVTSDAIILDQCRSWYNLNRRLIEAALPEAWVFRLTE